MVLFIFFFCWDGAEKGLVRVSLPLLRVMAGPVQHFRSAILGCLSLYGFFLGFLSGRVFGVVNVLIFKALYNCLPRPTCGNEIKRC